MSIAGFVLCKLSAIQRIASRPMVGQQMDVDVMVGWCKSFGTEGSNRSFDSAKVVYQA